LRVDPGRSGKTTLLGDHSSRAFEHAVRDLHLAEHDEIGSRLAGMFDNSI